MYTSLLENIYGPVYIASVYKAPNCKYGDEYSWACVILREETETEVIAHLHAVIGSPTPEVAASLRDKLLSEGYTHRTYDRWKNGKKRTFKLKL